MSVMRAAAVIGGFGFAFGLLFHFTRALRPLVLPTIRHLGQEQTTYLVLRFGGFSLSGWQILAFEGVVLLLSIGLFSFTVYVLVSG